MVGFVDAVLRAGYKGPLSLEIFNDEFRGAPAISTARGAKSSLIWLEERLHERATARGDQVLAAKLQATRPEAEAQHIAFIELRGASDRLPGIQEKLALIGCQSSGADSNQAACIRVLPGSGELHVSTIGLAAKDPRSAVLRARSLGCEVSETAETCELPDGSQVQMVQSGMAKQAGNLPQIESICRAVPVAEFDAWSSLSRVLLGDAQSFGFLKHAPSGVIRGRSLCGVGATFELETSTHSETQVAEAAIQRRITRITLAVRNLAATLTMLRDAGSLALELPEHYYDDLEARFLPTPTLIAELREQRMLYDRHGSGELFQALVPLNSGGLCLQLLERKGGYPLVSTDAANAYVANAALERWLSGNH
ncbi:MAG: hypothetical protein GAK36_00122 [Pseudomonas sp.]|nr:MAG: hypothetical protein GAK36_00122 [Pseudomonas sp.]